MIIVEGIDHLNIPVSDLNKSAKFYSDIFDFEILGEQTENSVVMSLNPIKIRLVKMAEVKNYLTEKNMSTLSFILDMDDFTEAITELENKEVKIVKGPESTADGESLTFGDPDNNLIEIFYKN